MTSSLLVGECTRWYLLRARHPFKDYLVGHFWDWFAARRFRVRYDNGTIGLRLTDYLQQQIFFNGAYEQPLIQWLKAALAPADVFWDVGANIGAITLVAAPLCRTVVAVEPDPRSLADLRANLEMNRIRNVEVVAAALGDRAGSATLHQAAALNTGMTSLFDVRGTMVGAVAVEVLRADDLIAARPDLAPTIMKLDVEGAELLVVRGASSLLKSGRLRALVFEDRRASDGGPANAAIVAALGEAGYAVKPFAASDEHAADGMYNFLATRTA